MENIQVIVTGTMSKETLMEILIILDCLIAFTGSMMTLQDTPEDVLGEKIFKMKIFQLFDLLKLEKVL